MVTNEEVVQQPGPKVEVAVASEQGRREENQDWFGWRETPLGELFVIADGMGGYKGGARAAKMTVDIVEQSLVAVQGEQSFSRAVTEALSRANREVHLLAHSGDPDTENMGSTALVVVLSNGYAQVAHVGDSRAYLLRNNQLQLLTRDHTRVQQMVDAKMLTPEQARHHPEGHLLSRAIGSRPEVEVDVSEPLSLQNGDALLLCSDGLSGFVSDEQIRSTLKQQRDVQAVPQALVDLALAEGGNDNITVQFVRVDGTVRTRVTAKMTPPPPAVMQISTPLLAGMIVGGIAAAVVALAVLGGPAIQFGYDEGSSRLRWNVSRADSVEIEPGIGKVDPTGERPLGPAGARVTYTLTASATRFGFWSVKKHATAEAPGRTAAANSPPAGPGATPETTGATADSGSPAAAPAPARDANVPAVTTGNEKGTAGNAATGKGTASSPPPGSARTKGNPPAARPPATGGSPPAAETPPAGETTSTPAGPTQPSTSPGPAPDPEPPPTGQPPPPGPAPDQPDEQGR